MAIDQRNQTWGRQRCSFASDLTRDSSSSSCNGISSFLFKSPNNLIVLQVFTLVRFSLKNTLVAVLLISQVSTLLHSLHFLFNIFSTHLAARKSFREMLFKQLPQLNGYFGFVSKLFSSNTYIYIYIQLPDTQMSLNMFKCEVSNVFHKFKWVLWENCHHFCFLPLSNLWPPLYFKVAPSVSSN